MRNNAKCKLSIKMKGAALFAALMAPFSVSVTAAESDGFAGLEVIVITASKKEETLQEAGMSVTALSALELERMGATGFIDFAVRVPNLGFGNESDGRFNANSPAIRGVFGANTTGFYIDEMPVPASMQPRVIDVQRVEVLRGPQGSLYGARSMGGTIRMITKQPDFDGVYGAIHPKISTVKEGGLNTAVDGSINIPIVDDKLAVRVTAYLGHNSGVFDRVYQPSWVNAQTSETVATTAPAFEKNKDVDDETYGGFQVVGLAQLNDNVTFTPKVMYQKVKADGLPFADFGPGNYERVRFFDTDEPGSEEWWLGSGTLNWDMELGTVVSTTSYFDREVDETEEEATFIHQLFNEVIGFVIDPLEGPISETEHFRSFVHETRFTSSFDGPLQFTAGVFYQKNKNTLKYPGELAVVPGLNAAVNAVTTAIPEIGGPIDIAPGDLIFSTDSLFNTEEYAVFGELTYDFNDWLSLTGGGRWYKTKTKTHAESDGFANDGPSRLPADISQDFSKQSESGFNPKILLQAAVNDELDLYASASKGYRIGGSNGNLPLGLCGDELNTKGIDPSAVVVYDSDSLWSYETGFKARLADNRVSLNAAVYLIKWSDIAQQNRLTCGFQYIDNAGKAESKGFEVELTAAPVEGLMLSAAVGYTNAKITDSEGVIGVSKGDLIQGVPNWTVSTSGEYIFPVSGDMEGMVRADFNHYGRSFSTNNGEQRKRPSWSALNLRAGIILNEWEVTLFANNVTNEHANLADSRNIAAEVAGRPRFVTNRPRTIGIDFRTSF